ncbi:pilus assembly FimT family protein [Halopseudomonas xiamenensis]|uniref:pilus assembly FimT family protein n=1 Tax=Halopseudomonas xiamenensis TaxID=157792 RepID=UPI002E288A97|nr:GspH/FimT family pseudopilin [Halopseudomonas xiamenensis]
MDRVKGFTLVEIMVTIAVAAILLGIAIPSFQTVSRNNAVRATTNDLISTINIARQQSMSMRTEVKVKPASGGWGDGWELEFGSVDAGEDAEFAPGKGVSISRTAGSGALEFLARGGRGDNSGNNAEFTVSHTDSSISSRTFCVSFFGKITTGGCS